MKFDDPNYLRKDFPRFTPEALERIAKTPGLYVRSSIGVGDN